ncbi:MAG: signal recognition particle-docking protein FtsY [Clostridia bacterium]|nr:signal recognition particle-docking protein FtsY [Clostridia bacterium]
MGFFKKIFSALKKTKDAFSKKISALFTHDKIGEEFYEDLTDILISSDVSYSTADEIVEDLRDSMIEERTSDKDYVVESLKNILIEKLEQAGELEIEYPAIITVIGVNGVGKTTSIGKLASFFKNEGKSVVLAAGDTFRAAAGEQLNVWSQRAGVRIISHGEGSDPSAVVYDAVSSMKAKNTDVLIVDTAGRLHVKSNLMEELKKISRVAEREYPEANFYKFIVLDATTGQNALSQVSAFDEAVGIDGIILTKLDGTAKGGFVISLCAENEIPVAFVGTGEGIDDIEPFDAQSFIDGLL